MKRTLLLGLALGGLPALAPLAAMAADPDPTATAAAGVGADTV
jgi:hypothetical protein